MSRRATALLALALLVVTGGAAAAKLPKVTPKTGTYNGKSVNDKKPGVLKVSKPKSGLRVSSLSLTFHLRCSDPSGTEKDVQVMVPASSARPA